MHLTSSIGLSLAVIGLAFGLSTSAQAGTSVNLPGMNIQTGGNGTSVVMPGVDIQTGYGSADSETETMVMVPGTQTRTVTTGTRRVVASGASYVNADLVGMNFRNQNLMGADFTNATLTNTDFSGANLSGALFKNADLTNTNFTNANLMGADLSNTSMTNTNLTNADLTHANLTNATIEGALAQGANFTGANLTNIDMSMFIMSGSAPSAQHVLVQMPQPTAPRPVFVDAGAIRQALTIDPAHPKAPHRIDLTVNFDFNSDKLTNDGMRQVNEIATALSDQSFRGARITVEGHTDNVGSDEFNQKLSYRRAARVQNTLINQYNIPGSQLTARGLGETQPVASNESDLGRATNRRVTLVNMGR